MKVKIEVEVQCHNLCEATPKLIKQIVTDLIDHGIEHMNPEDSVIEDIIDSIMTIHTKVIK